MIGVIRLTRKTPRSAAVSYILREDHWGTGHATRALRAVLPHAFDDLELLVLRARHHPDNAASGRVLERAGFTSLPAGRETIPYIHTRSAWRAATNPWTTLLPG